MAEHTTTAFDDELKQLTRLVVEMGGRAEAAVAQAVEALIKVDEKVAEHVIREDMALDLLQHDVDELAVLTIAKRQPMAIDLRDIVASMRIASDLERIGDMGKSIAKRSREINGAIPPRKLVGGIQHLSHLALEQLKDVLDAFVNRDAEAARAAWERDQEIDQIYTSLFRELLTYMMEDPRNITFCTHLLFCAKNLERIGDHATNIAETVIFMVTGLSELSKHGTRA